MAIEDAERSEQLLAAIGELSREDQEVLHLRYYLDLPEREIAATIGQRPGTVKSRLSRARERLRETIEDGYAGLRPERDASEEATR